MYSGTSDPRKKLNPHIKNAIVRIRPPNDKSVLPNADSKKDSFDVLTVPPVQLERKLASRVLSKLASFAHLFTSLAMLISQQDASPNFTIRV
jgi:hypothetical protein